MNERGKSLKEKLLEEFFRHLLAHSAKVAEGAGQPGCQFCPTLKIDARRPRRGFMNPGMFPQRFLRTLARDVNRIRRWALSGNLESAKFIRDLEEMVRNRPWDKPPASPGANLPAPLAGEQGNDLVDIQAA